jgi:hypothetical protein
VGWIIQQESRWADRERIVHISTGQRERFLRMVPMACNGNGPSA